MHKGLTPNKPRPQSLNGHTCAIFMNDKLVTMRFCGSYQHGGSVNCTDKLHASTSQFLLDIEKLIAELEESE